MEKYLFTTQLKKNQTNKTGDMNRRFPKEEIPTTTIIIKV